MAALIEDDRVVLDHRNAEEMTALQVARDQGEAEVEALLLAAGAGDEERRSWFTGWCRNLWRCCC